AIAASPWAPVVAIAGQRQIVMYNIDSGQYLGVMAFPEGIAHSLRFTPDGAYLIAGGGEHSRSGIAAIYDVKTGDRMALVGDDFDVALGADANADLSNIAIGGPQKMLRVYDVADGTKIHDLKKHTDWINDVDYSPDGILLASCDRSSGVVVWEAMTGRQYLDLLGHKGSVNALAWRDDSNVLASASSDGTVKLWDMNSGKQVKNISVPGGGVMDVQFDHAGRIVTACKDNRIRLFDANGKQIKEFTGFAESVLDVTISHDGKRVVGGDWSGKISSYNSDDPKQQIPLASNPPSLSARVDSLQQLSKTANQSLAAATKKRDAGKSIYDATTASVNKQQSDLSALEARIAVLKKEVGGLQPRVNQLATQRDQQQAAIDDL
ncbi:MAG: WD40 repeat domain-containing protein, partial [Planctomycetota bacterium]